MEDSILHRKEKLIITTIEIIDELGIQGLSTREIARRQHISEATLFRHFKNKNALLESVLDYFSQFDEDIYLSTKLKNLDAKEAIWFYISSFSEYYENYPAITSIMHLFDFLGYDTALSTKVKHIYENRTKQLVQLFEDAKVAGMIGENVDCVYLADTISGICREICLKWRLEGRDYSLKERTLAIVMMVLGAFLDKI